MITLARLYRWCKRFRHRCGYNVHSPSDFFLITSVIYEHYPYYAYKALKKLKPEDSSHYRRKAYRLLFRLINYLKPTSVVNIAFDNNVSQAYMEAASRNMKIYSLDKSLDKEEVSAADVKTDDNDVVERLKDLIDKKGGIDCIHVGFTDRYREIVDLAMNHINEKSIIIVANPYSSHEKERWWEELLEDKRVVISFDLYDIGLIMFPKKRYKQNYIVNFL